MPLLCVAGTYRSTTRWARTAGGSTAHEIIGSGVDSMLESVDESAAGVTSAAAERAWRRHACGGDVLRRRTHSASARASGARSSASASPVLGAVYVMYVPDVKRPTVEAMGGLTSRVATHSPCGGFLCVRLSRMRVNVLL